MSGTANSSCIEISMFRTLPYGIVGIWYPIANTLTIVSNILLHMCAWYVYKLCTQH